MEEFEILDLEELQREYKGQDQAAKYLQKKLQTGYKVSIMIKKQQNFSLPPLQQKKNDLFSKNHQPVEIISQSSEQTENNEKQGSSTSSHSSILLAKKLTIPATQNETPEQDCNEKRSQQSEEDQVSFYHIKNDSFEQLLKENVLSQRIQAGLLFMRDGKLKLGLERMMDTYKEANEKLKTSTEKDVTQQMIVLCIQSLCYAAQLLRELGQFVEAQKCLDKCLSQFEINDFDLSSKIYLEKALCCLLNNQLLQSLDYYQKALIQYEQINWKLDIAIILVKMSFVYALLNDFEDAKKMCYEGLSILQKKIGQQDHRIYETYYTLGCIFYLEKEYDFALEYLSQSKEGFTKLYGEKYDRQIKILNLQAIIYHLQGESLQAIDLYEQIVCLYGYQLYYKSENESMGLAFVLNNLALAYLDRMKFKSAKLSFEKATTILKEYFPESHTYVQRVEKNKILVAAATLSYI